MFFYSTGCPDGKKLEFITSLLDALTTDMVQAINSAAPAAGGRLVLKYKLVMDLKSM